MNKRRIVMLLKKCKLLVLMILLIIILFYILRTILEVGKNKIIDHILVINSSNFDDIFIVVIYLFLGLVLISGVYKCYNLFVSNVRIFEGKEFFSTIDKFKLNLKNSNIDNYFIQCYELINETYKGIEIFKMVKNNELRFLYKRKNFLENRVSYFSDILGISSAVIMSYVFTYFFPTGQKEINPFLFFIFFIFIIFFIISIKYETIGQDSLFEDEICKYELYLLNQVISKIEKKTIIDDKDYGKRTKLSILILLTDIRSNTRKRSKKKELGKVIEKVDNMIFTTASENNRLKLFLDNNLPVFFYLKPQFKHQKKMIKECIIKGEIEKIQNTLLDEYKELYRILYNYSGYSSERTI